MSLQITESRGDVVSEVPSTIDQMIADGELLETDRPRCVHWQSVTKCAPGTHERRLEQLD
jgi:hypothetical protein